MSEHPRMGLVDASGSLQDIFDDPMSVKAILKEAKGIDDLRFQRWWNTGNIMFKGRSPRQAASDPTFLKDILDQMIADGRR